MAHRIVIISPDAGLASALKKVLEDSGTKTDLTLLGDYPAPRELRSLTSSATDPVVFIVALTERDRAIDLINRLHTSNSDFLVAAADWTASPDTILAAMRAGSSEFLLAPFDVSHLLEAIKRKPTGKAIRSGRLLCVLPAKAGSGASTLAIHLAAAISESTQEKALLVDFDFHCGAVAYRMRLKPAFTLVDALSRVTDMDEMWSKVTNSWEMVDILAPPSPGELLTSEGLRDVPEVFASAKRSYSYTLVDLPPAVYSSSLEVLELADTIYVVSTPEMMCLHLAQRRVAELRACGLDQTKIRLILGRAGSKMGVAAEDVAQVVGLPIHHTVPNDYSAISEAFLKGGLAPKRSPFGHQIAALAGEITGVTPAPAKERASWQNLFRPHPIEAPSAG